MSTFSRREFFEISAGASASKAFALHLPEADVLAIEFDDPKD